MAAYNSFNQALTEVQFLCAKVSFRIADTPMKLTWIVNSTQLPYCGQIKEDDSWEGSLQLLKGQYIYQSGLVASHSVRASKQLENSKLCKQHLHKIQSEKSSTISCWNNCLLKETKWKNIQVELVNIHIGREGLKVFWSLALKYQDADSLKPNQFDPVGKSHLPNLSSPLCIWKS